MLRLSCSDNFLLGGVTLVETDIVYGAFYVMRPDLRGLGVGMTMMAHLMDMIAAAAKVKPVLGRGGLFICSVPYILQNDYNQYVS